MQFDQQVPSLFTGVGGPAVSVDGASKQQAMTRGLWHGFPTRSENRRPEDEAMAIPWNALVQQTNKDKPSMDVSISHQARGLEFLPVASRVGQLGLST